MRTPKIAAEGDEREGMVRMAPGAKDDGNTPLATTLALDNVRQPNVQ